MNCVLFLILLIVISFNLVGCVAIPLPSTKTFAEKPFLGEEVSSIEVGMTTKTEVEYLLGAPDATRRDSTIYIYAEPYIYGYCCFGTVLGGSVTRLEKHHLLIVQFDKEEIVKYVDHIVGNGSCTQNGICIGDTGLGSKWYWRKYPNPETSTEQMLVLYSNSVTDVNAAQRFIAPHGKVAIYLYREELSFFSDPVFINEKVSVNFDGIGVGDFRQEGFFYWTVNPGNHSITVTPLWPFQEGQTGRWHSASINIECKEGLIYFIEQTWDSDGFFKRQFKIRLTIISDQSNGRQEVLKRKMVLDCLSQTD